MLCVLLDRDSDLNIIKKPHDICGKLLMSLLLISTVENLKNIYKFIHSLLTYLDFTIILVALWQCYSKIEDKGPFHKVQLKLKLTIIEISFRIQKYLKFERLPLLKGGHQAKSFCLLI